MKTPARKRKRSQHQGRTPAELSLHEVRLMRWLFTWNDDKPRHLAEQFHVTVANVGKIIHYHTRRERWNSEYFVPTDTAEEPHNEGKLSQEDVKHIKAFARKTRKSELARRYKVSLGTILAIVDGQHPAPSTPPPCASAVPQLRKEAIVSDARPPVAITPKK